MSGDEMSFLEHLSELRKRLIYAAIGLVIAFGVVYHFSEIIFQWLMNPLCGVFENQDCQLITLGVAEAFMVYLKTGLLGGVFLAAPWIFFQIWRFISPGLHKNEKFYVLPFVLVASFMFVGGAGFGYFVVFPFAFEFFLTTLGPQITPMPSMNEYFGFASSLLFAFGALFEIPILVFLLNWIGIVSASSLWKTWRYAMVIIFALAAILTPADPLTMLLLGIPLSILYLASLALCSLSERARVKKNSSSEV